MPTYEYQCTACGTVFDVFQSIKAAPLRKTVCESCGEKRPVRRLIGTGGAVIFKGSGFYQTDYRSDSYKNAAKADGGSKPDSSSTSESSTSATSKSETKGGSKPNSESATKSSKPDSAVRKSTKAKD